jgi:hypothetical protein
LVIAPTTDTSPHVVFGSPEAVADLLRTDVL